MGDKRRNEGRSTDRRGFLKSLLVGGAGVALVAASHETPAAPDVATATEPAAQGAAGYRETAHVRRYYETAEF